MTTPANAGSAPPTTDAAPRGLLPRLDLPEGFSTDPVTHPYESALLAADHINATFGAVEIAIVLGSGWGDHVEQLGTVTGSIALSQIPGVPEPTVSGHDGRAIGIERNGRRVLALAGRSHLYEGHPPATVVHTVRAATIAGCHSVVLTNAAGSLRAHLGIGQPVLIGDQLNLSGANPMCGPPPPAAWPGRFADLSDLYDRSWRERIVDTVPGLAEGVYAGMLGGSYETPAEIAMLERLGADLVGMSTVLEAIAAHHLGARIAGVSLVTNAAAGLGEPLSHDEVLAAGAAARTSVAEVLGAVIDTAGERPR